MFLFCFFFSSRRRHTRLQGDWSSDVCSSDLNSFAAGYTVVVSNPSGSVTSAPPANLTINPAGVAIALYPGVKIDGVVGLTYGIQYSTDLANTNGWIGVTNLTFTQPTEIWYDSIPASMAQRFYRVLQGPIPIP